ncbi:MAG: YfhO family protein, partial [Chloroflexi bacterium]|nr:YfhO family protein [Chloroflexota bacterium]
MIRRSIPELVIVAGLLLLPLLFFAPVTLGNKTLLPADNLYQYEPWLSARGEVGVPDVPHNALLSDLVLENYQWKSFLRQSISDSTIPLWQPNQFAGSPFLATGQHSALYPFSAIYYIMPLPRAYGWFTVSQLWLAGALMYLFVRGIGLRRISGAVAGVAYQFSAFFIVSAVFPMMIAGAAWLPLLLLMIEYVIQQRPVRGERPAVVPWIAIGAIALMMNIFAGHIEITYYTLIVMAYYAAARLVWEWWPERRNWRRMVRPAASLLTLVALGIGLGAVQFIPLYEMGTHNFREDADSFDTVTGYAFPKRHVAKFVMPNVYGNPAHHGYRDAFEWKWVNHDWERPRADGSGTDRVTNTDFGIKNYVEGGAYMGILVLVLAGIGLFAAWPGPDAAAPAYERRGWRRYLPRMQHVPAQPPYRVILLLLMVVALTFA